MKLSPCQTDGRDHPPARRPRRRQRSDRRPSRRSLLAALALILAMLAAACGGEDSDSSAMTADDSGFSFEDSDASDDAEFGLAVQAPQEAMADDAEDAMEDSEPAASESDSSANASTTGSAGSDVAAQLPDLGRDIIYTATLELASGDVSAATREAIRSVEARGGFLFSQETRGGSGGSSVLTFKVLPDQFQAVLNDLGSIGNVRSQTISADDVTSIVVDLESRINTSEASVIRLRDLLESASELETIATLENQLLQRETTLEQLRGQLRTVRKQVDLATITVFVTELLNRPGIALESMSFAGHDGGFSCFDTGTTRSGEVGDAITACYRITNTGDAPLVDVTIDGAALEAGIADMVVVDGDTSQIDPGEVLVLAHEFELSESFRVRPSVTATGLDDQGNSIEDPVAATAQTVRFDVIDEDDGFPSFGEVLGNSWSALLTIALGIALAAVAVAPFLAVALLLWIPVRYAIRTMLAARPNRVSQPRSSATTPPPPPGPPAPGDQNPSDEETTVNA